MSLHLRDFQMQELVREFADSRGDVTRVLRVSPPRPKLAITRNAEKPGGQRRTSFGQRLLSVALVSQQALPANSFRNYLLIQNNDPIANIFVSFGKPSTLTSGIKLLPNGVIEYQLIIPIDSVHVIGDAATSSVILTEG
jgi:hypothetical protein